MKNKRISTKMVESLKMNHSVILSPFVGRRQISSDVPAFDRITKAFKDTVATKYSK